MTELCQAHPIVEEFLKSTTFNYCGWFIVFVLLCWLVKILNRFLSRKIILLFEKTGPLDEQQKQKVTTLVFLCTTLFVLMQISGAVWIGILRRRCNWPIFGVEFGYGFGRVQAIFACAFTIFSIKLIHLFHKTYEKCENSNKRPIHVFVNLLYVALCLLSIFAIISMLTKERPIILLSTFGAGFAIFVFAFKDLLASAIANLQLNIEKNVKVGDWIALTSHDVDGTVEAISARTIQVRNWDMSLASLPIKRLMDETFVNYTAMQKSKARQIRRSLLINQKSVRFVTPEELQTMKEKHLLTDEILKRAETFDDTSKLSPSRRLWTNLELFALYTDNYLASRQDIHHDMDCVMRTLNPTGIGIPMEIYCYSTLTSLVEFEERQRGIVCHLLAVLPLFHLHVYQVSTIRMDKDGVDTCSVGTSA